VSQDKGRNDGKNSIKRIVSWGGGVGTPVLIAILVIVLTPIGDQIRNSLFPSYAVVEGSLYQDENRPAPKSKLVLDDEIQYTWTDAAGNFFFQKVSPGTHSYWIYDTSNNILAGPITFIITEGETKTKLGLIQLNNIQPRAQQAPSESNNDAESTASPESAPEARLAENTTANRTDTVIEEDEVSLMYNAELIESPSIHNITVWIEADPQTLSKIEKVTYYLHEETFEPDIVPRYSVEDKFSLSVNAWGEFTIGANVFFKDGNEKPLTKYLEF
jgi:hypothetical protein